jgi:hypothetical protein
MRPITHRTTVVLGAVGLAGTISTDEEAREGVAMAAISRHRSTVLNGMQIDLAAFRQETDSVLRMAAEKEAAPPTR